MPKHNNPLVEEKLRKRQQLLDKGINPYPPFWEKKRQTSQWRPVGRPPKKRTKKYREYNKQKVIQPKCRSVYTVLAML